MRITLFRIALFLYLTTPSFSQTLTRPEMEKDIRYLDRKLVNLYPGLGYYSPTADYEASRDSIISALPDSMSYLEFYRTILPLISNRKDGHLNVYHRKKFTDKKTPYLPLYIRDSGGRYYVAYNAGIDSTLHRGDELLTIEGEPIGKLHALFADRFRAGADADIASGRYTRTLLAFSNMYLNWYGAKDSLRVGYVRAGTIDTLETYVHCQASNLNAGILRKRYPGESRRSANLSLRDLDGTRTTAVLNVITFSPFEKRDPFNLKFRKKLQRDFATIQKKGYKNLVIDLRSNGGGAIVNSGRLLSYLLPEPYRVMRESSLKPKAVIPYIIRNLNPVSLVQFFIHHHRDRSTGLWHSNREKAKKSKPDTKYPFRGNVYFLANGASYSATVSVLAHARSQGVGQIVGESPGGAYWGDFAARFRIVTLPHSKIQVRMPLKKLYHDVKPSDQLEIVPDYPVVRTYEDVVTPGRDYGMEYIRKLLGSKKGQG